MISLVPWPPSGHGFMLRLRTESHSHACYLVELPTPPGAARGIRIMFDPVFSNRCSPFKWMGPARYTGMGSVHLLCYSFYHAPLLQIHLAKSKRSLRLMPLYFQYVHFPVRHNSSDSSISTITMTSTHNFSITLTYTTDNILLAPIYRHFVHCLPTLRLPLTYLSL
jgi:hypothetical protein